MIRTPGRDPAQKPLKIWAVWAVFQQDLSGLSGFPARFERFERFSSKIWAVWAVWLWEESPHSLTDKASDFGSEDCGLEYLCGRLSIIKSY